MLNRECLFVYGSFSEGMVHFNKISEFIAQTSPARVLGSLYKLRVGFPAFCDEGTTVIQGNVVELVDTQRLFPLLDEFHGVNHSDPKKGVYTRVQKEAFFDGSIPNMAVWVYSINPSKIPKSATLIEDGNWQRVFASEHPLTEVLTLKQRDYLLKLGQSSGRGLVPIDMRLYRELLNLELIEDKGRRLALTPLGKELVRFLQ